MEKPKMTKEIIISIIDKLVGPIEPVASSSIDSVRIENCEIYLGVFEEMYSRINDIVWRHKDTNLGSVKAIQKLCENSINEIKDNNIKNIDVITHLYKKLSERHNMDEGMILLHYQDNKLYACEQDYDSLKMLEQIDFNK